MTDGLGPANGEHVEAAITRTFRDERTGLLATLVRHVGDLQLAEDAMQEAFTTAVAAWQRDGVPDRPGAWITVAARRAAIDRLRRAAAQVDRAHRLAELMRLDAQEHEVDDEETTAIVDDRLRLIFTCCHPALSLSARVALTLRTVGGLTTCEIARAFVVAEPTMGKRIVRAKRKIADAQIPYRIPDQADLPARVDGVLQVIYLIFNEGYSALTADGQVRAELCGEAIGLTRLLCQLMPDEAEALGLLALQLLLDARRSARVDADGAYVALPDQDRALWDTDQIREGLAMIDRALRLRAIGPYQVEAAIAGLHVQADRYDAAHWSRVAMLYEGLSFLNHSPVIEVNHAAAVGRARGPRDGLRLLAPLLQETKLERYQPLHATNADLLQQIGDIEAAARAYERAIELSTNSVEQTELRRRLARLRED